MPATICLCNVSPIVLLLAFVHRTRALYFFFGLYPSVVNSRGEGRWWRETTASSPPRKVNRRPLGATFVEEEEEEEDSRNSKILGAIFVYIVHVHVH